MEDLNFNELNYTPSHGMSHASLSHPTRVKLFIDHMASVPRSVSSDGILNYGGGTGVGWDAPRKAFGEFFERNHFFNAVKISSHKPLKTIEPLPFRQKLAHYCQQIQHTTADCLQHSFYFTTVSNLFDGTEREFFLNAISLHGQASDSAFITFSDSCACASHSTKQNALTSSLTEFLERQSLLGSWTTKKIRYTINPMLLLKITPYAILVDSLLENGHLFIFENGINLPGYSIIIFYFSKSAKDLVQYSVGSNADLSLKNAIVCALEELWQCYNFQYNTESSFSLPDKAGSDYHLHFQQCNNLSVKNLIPFFDKLDSSTFDMNSLEDIEEMPSYSYNRAIIELGNISCDIYCYEQFDPILNIYYSKIVSPDFFMHMSVDKPLNFDNAYAQTLGVNRSNAYKEKIPFP